MARINPEEIDELRKHADIVDVISHYVQVHQKGRSYKALCPFHQDHDPSMNINRERQIFKCFVCGAGGSVFKFVQDYEKISFPEAVGRVAQLTGFSLSVQPDAGEKPKDPHKDALRKVLNETIQYAMYQLDTTEALPYREYLEKRGLDRSICEEFQIGFNPYGNQLSTFLKAKGYAEKDMVSANVSSVSPNGIFDVFAGRIMFPIHDMHGNPVGFSARTLDPQNPSKYINTNETDLFVKRDLVYNYHRARTEARREGKIYVCEGVTDVIAFHRAGIKNAVCTLGTSCTENQIRLLKQMAPRIVFCYDGDHAGQAAAFKASKMAAQMGCDTTVVLNTTGKDPDEIINQAGAEELRKIISHELSRMEFVLHYLQSETNMDSYLDKKELVDKALAEIRTLDDETDIRYFTEQLSEITGFHIENSYHPQSRRINPSDTHVLKVPDGTKEAEELILCMMINSPQAVIQYENTLGYLLNADAQAASLAIIDYTHRYQKADSSAIADSIQDPAAKELIAGLVFSPYADIAYDRLRMDGAVKKIQIAALDEQVRDLQKDLTVQISTAGRNEILKKIEYCNKEKRRLRDEENGNRTGR